jgi:FAD synthase
MKTAFFTFGKFSPPTLGHKLMIEEMIKKANGSDVYIVASESVRPENAPINVNQKLRILREMFKNKNVKVISAKSPLNFVRSIEGNYNRVNMVVGENRIGAFNWMKKHTPKYGGSVGIARPHGAISATAVRKSAREGKIREMKKMLNSLPQNMIDEIYKTIRSASKKRSRVARRLG